MDDRQCQHCKYWKAGPGSMGDCRRYAPRPGDKKEWPRTNPDDWCGEFKSKEQTE